jgi:serine/threonine-protein kinase
LIDFGLMKQVERQIEMAAEHFNAAGTVEYAPPEQYAEMDWGMDARSDLYSLGATLYYLLAGRLPPRAAERVIPGTVNLTYKLPSMRQYNLTVRQNTQRVIFKALEFDPGHRFPSARRMRETLLPTRRYLILPF